MKKLLFLLSVACSTLLLNAQTNQVVWLNGKVYYQQPVTAIDSITYDMNNMLTGDTLQLILPRATQQNPSSTITPKVKLLDAQTNQVVWLNGKVLYEHPVSAIDSITYDMNNMITGDTLKLILPRATKEIVYQTISQEIHDTIINVVRDTVTKEVHDTIINVVRDTIINVVRDTVTKEVHDTIINVVRDTIINVVRETVTKEVHDTIYIKYPVIMGAFSVSADKQIAFSLGNLQYTQSTAKWSFAENQYDMLGEANVSRGVLADKIDLFGWSGSTGSAQWGISTSAYSPDYSGDFVDWGTNTIGTAIPNTYRTLTQAEWAYLLNTRTNASEKKGVARIKLSDTEYANGLILLPDDWTCPAGITFKSGFASSNGKEYYATYQTFTLAEWQRLEAAGAVFLPASGRRDRYSMYDVKNGGNYWSATAAGLNYANSMHFDSTGAGAPTYYEGRNYGYAVRLVKDL